MPDILGFARFCVLGGVVALGTPALAGASPPSVTDTAAAPAEAPAGAPASDAAAPAGDTAGHAAPPAAHRHRRAAARAHAAPPPAGATVALTTQPGSALETTATRLVASDLKQSRSAGDPPVMLVGSANLSVKPGPAALFVQVQSADFCGSAGCSTSAYVQNGGDAKSGGWTKVLDSISGPIKVSRRSHHGMYDLLVHGTDRWIWNGTIVCGHVAVAGRGSAAFDEEVAASRSERARAPWPRVQTASFAARDVTSSGSRRGDTAPAGPNPNSATIVGGTR